MILTGYEEVVMKVYWSEDKDETYQGALQRLFCCGFLAYNQLTFQTLAKQHIAVLHSAHDGQGGGENPRRETQTKIFESSM